MSFGFKSLAMKLEAKLSLGGFSGGSAPVIWTVNAVPPGGAASTGGGIRTDGIAFSVTEACELITIGYFVGAGETDLNGADYTVLLYSTVTGVAGVELVRQAGGGVFTAGQVNYVNVGWSLVPGVVYVAAVSSPNLLEFLHNYWGVGDPGAGGITVGPVVVPDGTTAPGGVQQGNALAADTFPQFSTFTWYGVAFQVQT